MLGEIGVQYTGGVRRTGTPGGDREHEDRYTGEDRRQVHRGEIGNTRTDTLGRTGDRYTGGR